VGYFDGRLVEDMARGGVSKKKDAVTVVKASSFSLFSVFKWA
jgi:hypothetical protein